MRVPRSQKPRYGRGNLVKARAALAVGDPLALVAALSKWAKARQKTARENQK